MIRSRRIQKMKIMMISNILMKIKWLLRIGLTLLLIAFISCTDDIIVSPIEKDDLDERDDTKEDPDDGMNIVLNNQQGRPSLLFRFQSFT